MTAPDFTIADKLREARALVERGWTQKHWARNAEDKGLLWDDPKATNFCARGAIWRVSNGGEVECTFERAIKSDDIANWNDAPERTKDEVLAAFDHAIELASPSQ